jgi:hypothetical protein
MLELYSLKQEGTASILRGQSVRCSWAVKMTAVPKMLRGYLKLIAADRLHP